MNPFTAIRLACVLALFLAVTVRGAAGQEQSFGTANCALTPPPGWQLRDIKNQKGLVAAFGDADNTRTLMVLVIERGKITDALNDAYVAGFDKGVAESGGGPKTSGKFVQLASFQAYERRGTAVAKGKNLSTLALAIPTGDGIYLLEALSLTKEVSDDVEVRQAVNSFRFLHPPGPPRQPPGAAYRAGYVTGQALMGLALLGVIAWAISKAVSRRTPPTPAGFSGPYPYPQTGFSPPPAVPPPVPPAGPVIPSSPPPLPPSVS